jgi:hypothetical protein
MVKINEKQKIIEKLAAKQFCAIQRDLNICSSFQKDST